MYPIPMQIIPESLGVPSSILNFLAIKYASIVHPFIIDLKYCNYLIAPANPSYKFHLTSAVYFRALLLVANNNGILVCLDERQRLQLVYSSV